MNQYSQTNTNPLRGNPLQTRRDMQDAVTDLCRPLLEEFSPGRARVVLGHNQGHFHPAAAQLEGLARPLWGLTPLIAGGGRFEGIDFFLEGLSNGANPSHDEYWGPVRDRDQRMVESAAIGYALTLAPEVFWDGLTQKGRDCLRDWLLNSLQHKPPPNNWNFFHVMVSLGLSRIGVEHDRSIISRNLDAIESWYMGDGWYRDGNQRQADHYIPFAMHFYGLIYAKYGPDQDRERKARFSERAALFAPQMAHLFAKDGSGLPYGRSLTYRFAHAGFWGALALADVEAIGWGETRGLWARNLRWWSDKPVADPRGVLTVGYCYPQLSMAERYNSPGSPYWALKAFAPLALDDDHSFWKSKEVSKVESAKVVSIPKAGFVSYQVQGDVTALSGGQCSPNFGRAAEKYGKFAYSTRYGFSVEADARSFENGPFDNMLAFSEDGHIAAVRCGEKMARIGRDWLYSHWAPLQDVEVESWLFARPPWHLRIHRVQTKRRVMTVEGGFAIAREDPTPDIHPDPDMFEHLGLQGVRLQTRSDVTCIIDGSIATNNGVGRKARLIAPEPNTNLMAPQTWVPQLTATLVPGTWTFSTWVGAVQGNDLGLPPDLHLQEAELVKMREQGEVIGVWYLQT